MALVMWVVMIYMFVLTIFVPLVGRLADMIGRKKLYVSGFVVFIFGSLLCGLSRAGWQLLLFRLIQSVGGVLIQSSSVPIITDAFPKKELGKALGINGMIISVASVIGPILGGAIVPLGWRFIFFINIPIGLFVSAIGLLGMMRIKATTSIAELIIWMIVMGLGSGMFVSPNTNSIMGAVPIERRGIAAGVRIMMQNAGTFYGFTSRL